MAEILPFPCLKLMKKGYIVSNNIITNPYQWKRLENGPQSVRSPLKKALWHLNAFLVLCQAIFSAVQCWRLYYSDDAKQSYKIYMVFSTLFYTFGVCLQLANYGHQRALPRFVRGYIHFFRGNDHILRDNGFMLHN